MTKEQATKQLADLGFRIEIINGCTHGTIEPELFEYPCQMLSDPIRDVFIGETRKAWYVTSHINFKTRRKYSRESHLATILNIFGAGKTLEEAMNTFVQNFSNKIYNQYNEPTTTCDSPSKKLKVVGVEPW